MTSASVSPEAAAQMAIAVPGRAVRVIDQKDLIAALESNPLLGSKRLSPARRRRFLERSQLSLAIIGGVLSLLVGVAQFFATRFFGDESDHLRDRIETVEGALASLKDLEEQLTDIKKDMVETEQATAAIKAEYERAAVLKKLTAEQLQAVGAAVRAKSWRQTFLDYLVGFGLGVAGSLTASVIYSRTRRRLALTQAERS
jgi:hypothetical protein